MATDVIESLSSRLVSLAEGRNCEYEAWIFTNRYLLSKDVVGLRLRCQVTKVHIPLDGVGATNDATLRLVGGALTFDRIMNSFLSTVVPSHDDECYRSVWLPLCGGGCPQLRQFGKPECPAYRFNPEAFVLAMNSRSRPAR